MTAVRFGVRGSRRAGSDRSGARAEVARQAQEAGRDPGGASERVSSANRPPDGAPEQVGRCSGAAAAAGA